MDDKQMPFGNPFWMAASFAPALAVTQSLMGAAMRIYWAGMPARMVMGAAPFAMMGWSLSRVAPQPDLSHPETPSTPSTKRTDGATDAEIVSSRPRQSPRMKLVVPEPVVEAPAVAPEATSVTAEPETPIAEAAIEEIEVPAQEPPMAEPSAPDTAVMETAVMETVVTETATPEMNVPERPTALAEAPEDGGDDLRRIKGIGVKLAAQLNGLGYYRFSQIAAWGEPELAWVDSNLVGFNGRATRDDWIGQAKALMADPASDAMH